MKLLEKHGYYFSIMILLKSKFCGFYILSFELLVNESIFLL
jgi:hypothetical protein